ncbi:uncharacterized protein LOC126789568 [Argentina anserina]|uniref:uncharacterized protein LOC126789568 n=1 Tax=Argentina anserina TaxID=57926 RepID=UPI0021763E60|nr:uncharacterized protein LOC126789568 [Potentilla anserina]
MLQLGLFFLFIFSLLPLQYGVEVHKITHSHPLAVGQTLISPGLIFELGFFSPNNSANKYVGLWHRSIFPRKYVWVANRASPLAATDTLATLVFSSNGNLELVDGKQNYVWSANISNCSSAVLLDEGNFVVKNVTGAVMWESFNNPSDTLLPNMLLGYDRSSGKQNFLTSWKSKIDPSPGIFLGGLSEDLPAQVFVWINGSTPRWRGGPWDESKFIGIPWMNSQYQSPGRLVDNETQGSRYFSYSFDRFPGDNVLGYIDISSEGIMTPFLSESGKTYWSLDEDASENPCDIYGSCGSFGVCRASESPICKCLKGFKPKSNEEWRKRNWTQGCVRRTNLSCETHTNRSDGFFMMERLKVPDFHEYLNSVAVDKIEDCKIECLDNCSCLAYSYVNNIGCLVWFKDLIDIQQFSSFGEDLYVRLADSELGEGNPIKLIASLTAIGFMIILVGVVFSLHRWRANQKRSFTTSGYMKSTTQHLEQRDGLREYIGKHDFAELKIYDFHSLLIATDNFSITNKLGQGGFGPVYKGMLPEGKEIAVKRLSSGSGQGVEEFKNEMLLISNLQHKNLVRMMGCCVKEDEKLLIYEFLPNKSLDTFLFDPMKRAVLDWATRFNIIHGIVSGLLYLHRDSHVKVIHRDLKVSNILLDEKMSPKISDFGLARIVQEKQSSENTQKVVGTRGYMSPEYAMGGIFSEKSDVYSFGVLVLEIVSGKKNTSFCLHNTQQGFLAYAWNLWNEGRTLELVDEVLCDLYSSSEVMTCVHVGLLCVQDNAADRPTMVDVASILSSEKDDPQPKRPVFTIQNSAYHPQPHSENTNSSKNEASITMIEGLQSFNLLHQVLLGFIPAICHDVDGGFMYGVEVYNITPSHPLAEGQTVVSPGLIFELGFFSPNNSANKYVGLWHKSLFPRKYVWVANRVSPLAATNTLATLGFGSNGNLELVDGKQSYVWSANISNCSSAVLLDNGNFVVKNVMGDVMWESFNNPSDSLLAGMLLGYDRSSGTQNFLSSWRSENDPSPGISLFGLSAELSAQLFIRINGSTPHWRSGPWDKSKFIGIPTKNSQYQNPASLVDNETQGTRYYSFSFDSFPGFIGYVDISSEGIARTFVSESGKNWYLGWDSLLNPCDVYGACGPFGVCKASESPLCKCLKGFRPKSNEEWRKGNWTQGCVRRTNLSCETPPNVSVSTKGKDGFFKMERLKVPDFHEYVSSVSVDMFEDCKIKCLNNCSCLAFSYVNNIGCLVWYKDLIDIQQFPSLGEDLYVRLAESELGKEKPIKLIGSLTAIGFMIILVAVVFSLHRWRANQKRYIKSTAQRLEHRVDLREYIGKHDFAELKIYDFHSILIATDNFSITNKLGQGGFGPVYKGMLPEGKEIAVKRLSSSSGQGVEEFKNEMLLISNLQHKNLVRMMGCCVKEDEKLLIYEFLPNKSLDTFLFDPLKRTVLDWTTLFNIIQGVARGLLYLHHDSYVKVIHRDLKVSNILLDENMNPKISDFGLARMVEEKQSLENTQKVVGTRGYMSPEYAMNEIFSEKSDVYSFGVLVLEIISGIKNTSFYLYDQHLSFLAYAWKLWNEGRGLELVSDVVLSNSYSSNEVLKCMQIGLLCVQDSATDRPTMADVASLLSSDISGPQPVRPVFTIQNSVPQSQPKFENTSSSTNEATITMIEGR